MDEAPPDPLAQREHDLRLAWGPVGMARIAADVDVAIVVDVFSFSTCVEYAIAHGVSVVPCKRRDEEALRLAERHGAVLARRRGEEAGGPSLSPGTFARVGAGTTVVLPSPNGATLSRTCPAPLVLAGCLRNAKAVAAYARHNGRRICVVAAGEQWPDGSLRPALEDQVGAGAILRHLEGRRSPEAEAAEILARTFAPGPGPATALAACASARELAMAGYARDVELAIQVDVSTSVPVLRDGVFVRA